MKGKLCFEGEYMDGERWNWKEYEYKNGKQWNGRRAYEFCKIANDEFTNPYAYADESDYLKFESEILEGKLWNGKIYDFKNNIICEWKEGKGFIKEYDYGGELIFEGEYLNGERNGKGKEYDYSGELIFEGQYLNGERNGKEKDYYYENGKLIFEGEYLKGKRWNVNIKEYYKDDILIFEGEYLNGERNGKGKEYYYDGK